MHPLLIVALVWLSVAGFFVYLNYRHHKSKHIEDSPEKLSEAFMGGMRMIDAAERTYS